MSVTGPRTATASGLIRSISQVFDPLGGAALIYSLGTVLLVVGSLLCWQATRQVH